MSRRVTFRVGVASCGVASGAREVADALQVALRDADDPAASLQPVGCGGLCYREPLVEVVDGDGDCLGLYARVTPAQAGDLVRRYVRPRRLSTRARWLLRSATGGAADTGLAPEGADASDLGTGNLSDPKAGAGAHDPVAPPRIVLENCGRIDPTRLDDALERAAYAALRTCLEKHQPDDLVRWITDAGLRGRGGAGFPTGLKWSLAQKQPAPKFVICNGDEGDPGAFMDRLVLESDPHRVLEGLALAAWAVGAGEGFFYIRAEYPQAVRHIRGAIRQAEEAGFLGENILGSGFSLKLSVREGAGAFVCGEETALIASLEGRRGMPRLRPPYPVERGFRDRPTVINNVETLASVPWIVRHGAGAYAALGTEKSKGTKVFALAGKIRRGGLIEVPMGITIRRIVEELGGGVRDGRSLKAVQLGGPSGGCLPAELADTPVDYEALTASGAIMGSGGLVVLDDRDCMVDIARFFLHFTCDESCGKCTFCRIGTRRMLEILDRLCEGSGRVEDLDDLEELAERVARASLCGLGQTAPNPVKTSLRYFRDEFRVHAEERRCPAGRCASLIRYRVNDACIGCTLCAQVCPVNAIAYRPHEKHVIDDETCTRCTMCFEICADGAVDIVSGDTVCATSARQQERVA